MKRSHAIARSLVLAAAALLLFAARPGTAQAYTAEGWQWFKKGDFVLTPINLGVASYIGTGDNTATKTTFGLFTDFDYHLTGEMAVGAIVNMSFGENFIGFDFGPQFKYKFKLASNSHFPYVRAGLPMRIMLFRAPNDFTPSTTVVGLGILMGGGYRYFFNRRFGVGADLSLVPTIALTKPEGSGTFYFGLNFSVGVDIKF